MPAAAHSQSLPCVRCCLRRCTGLALRRPTPARRRWRCRPSCRRPSSTRPPQASPPCYRQTSTIHWTAYLDCPSNRNPPNCTGPGEVARLASLSPLAQSYAPLPPCERKASGVIVALHARRRGKGGRQHASQAAAVAGGRRRVPAGLPAGVAAQPRRLRAAVSPEAEAESGVSGRHVRRGG